MSYLTIKIIKGNPYLYEVRSERDGDRVRQVFVAYLGRADKAYAAKRQVIVKRAKPIIEPKEITPAPIAEKPVKPIPIPEVVTPQVTTEVVAPEVTPPISEGITLKPTTDPSTFDMVRGGEVIGSSIATPLKEENALMVMQIAIKEPNVLNRSILRDSEIELKKIAESQGLDSIRILARGRNRNLFLGAGYTEVADSANAVEKPISQIGVTPEVTPEIISTPQIAKDYIIKKEPEPLLPSGFKYMVYQSDDTPMYISGTTQEEAESKLKQGHEVASVKLESEPEIAPEVPTPEVTPPPGEPEQN